jgi:hypothetical protein
MTKRDDEEIEYVEMLEYWINLLSFGTHSLQRCTYCRYRHRQARPYDDIAKKTEH